MIDCCEELYYAEDIDKYVCGRCDKEYDVKISHQQGVVVQPPAHDSVRITKRGMTMSFDASSLPSSNTVNQTEAGAWIARQAEEQGIGNSFKVYYNGDVMGKLEDLPQAVVLSNLRVSAALDQACEWFAYDHEAYAVNDVS